MTPGQAAYNYHNETNIEWERMCLADRQYWERIAQAAIDCHLEGAAAAKAWAARNAEGWQPEVTTTWAIRAYHQHIEYVSREKAVARLHAIREIGDKAKLVRITRKVKR